MKNTPGKITIVFRRTRSNCLSLPLLFSIAENSEWKGFIRLRECSFQTLLRTPWKKGTVIAYSFMTSELASVLREVRLIKKRFGDKVFLLAGGPHPTGNPGSALRMGFDAAAAGPAESLLPLFLRELFEGDIRYRTIFRSADSCLEQALPISITTSLMPPLEITRGCHYRCRFCQTASKSAEHRSPDSVVRYLDELVRRQYLNRVGFICPSAFEYGSEKAGRYSIEPLRKLFDLVRSRGFRFFEYGIFPSEIRPDTVRPKFLELIRSFCSNRKLTVGAQSGSDRTLRKLRRGHSVYDIERASALIREYGFRPQLDFIFGIPGEAEEDLMNTLAFTKKMALKYGAWIQSHYFLPLSGTPLEKENPAPLSKAVRQRLLDHHQSGFCTRWWETGIKISEGIKRAREETGG